MSQVFLRSRRAATEMPTSTTAAHMGRSTGQFTGFDDVVDVAGQTVKLITKPEDLVFQEK